jgi:hypothetical protein
MYRPLRMIGSVFATLYRRSFCRLIGVGKLLHALLGSFLNRRKSLRITGLARALWTYLSRVIPEFVELRLVIA